MGENPPDWMYTIYASPCFEENINGVKRYSMMNRETGEKVAYVRELKSDDEVQEGDIIYTRFTHEKHTSRYRPVEIIQ